jgi:hypothetical protein
MIANYRLHLSCRLPQRRFEPDTIRFLAPRVNFWEPQPTATERLTARLLARALRTFSEPHLAEALHHAAREAAALAESTGYPLLVFPDLFAELAITAMVEAEYRVKGGFRFASRFQP